MLSRKQHSSVVESNGEDRSAISFDGVRIGWSFYPSLREKTGPPVLVVPGFWRTRSHHSIVHYAQFLQGEGFSVATVDLRGHGESGGTFGFNFNEHMDVEVVARELMEEAGAHSVMLAGFSYGGAVAISTAAATEVDVTALYLVSPVAELERIRPRINPFTIHRHVAPGQAFHRPAFTKRVFTMPRRSALDDVRAVRAPIHFLHFRNDWLIDHTHSEQLASAHPGPHEVEILDMPGNYHADRIFHAAPGRVEESSLSFFRKQA